MCTKTTVSYLLPTARDWNEYGSRVVTTLASFIPSHHEIVVYCENDPNDSRVRWVREPAAGLGCVMAFNMLFAHAKGDVIATLCDDVFVGESIVAATESLLRDRYTLLGLNPGYCTHSCLPLPIVDWCAMHRELIQSALGGVIFNPAFRHHYCDHWLTYYAHSLDIPMKRWPTNAVHANFCQITTHDCYDKAVYYKLLEEIQTRPIRYDRNPWRQLTTAQLRDAADQPLLAPA